MAVVTAVPVSTESGRKSCAPARMGRRAGSRDLDIAPASRDCVLSDYCVMF